VERLSTYEQVVALTAHDPVARWTIDPGSPIQAVARDGAVLWTTPREHYSESTWSTALGPVDAVAALVTDVLRDPGIARFVPTPAGVTVPHGAMALIPAELRPPEFGDWIWWWTDEPPPRLPAEDDVQAVDLSDAKAREELAALLVEANPHASSSVEDPRVRTWAAMRVGGRLVACAADRPYEHGVAHLASIATLPEQRGRGYGSAVTAWMTRRRLVDDEAAVVTLGMYADNAPAHSVYERLGFRSEHRFTSGSLPPQQVPAAAG